MPINAHAVPRNPLRTYQFRVKILTPPLDAEAERTFLGAAPPPQPPPRAEGAYVAGVSRVSGLSVTISPHETWEGGNALHRYANPDRAAWEPITLEQGLALDDTLERWADAVVRFLRTGTVDQSEPVKRNVIVDVWDPDLHGRAAEGAGPADAGQRLRRYLVTNAWISKLRAVPQLDAMANEVALLSVELTHDGWRAEQFTPV